jgi:hypothetical protein
MFLSLKSAVDLLLLGVYFANFLGDQRVATYFYTYWCGNGLAALAELWMIIQVACALVSASPKAVKWVWRLAPFAAAVCFFGASRLPIWPNYGPQLRIVSMVVGLDRLVAMAWLATFLCIAAFSDLMGFRWRRHPLGIAIGFAIVSTTEIGVSWFLGTLTFTNARLLSDISGAAYLLALVVWTVSISKNEQVYELAPRTLGVLSDIVLTYRAALERTHAR